MLEAVSPAHGKGEVPNAIGILSKIETADDQVLADDLENVVEDIPGRIRIVEQDVTAGFQSAGAFLQVEFLQSIADIDAIVRIAGDAGHTCWNFRESLLETHHEGRSKPD